MAELIQTAAEHTPSFKIISLVFMAIVSGGILIGLVFDFSGPTLRKKLALLLEKETFYWGFLILFALILVITVT